MSPVTAPISSVRHGPIFSSMRRASWARIRSPSEPDRIRASRRARSTSPKSDASCAAKPCLTACPAGALDAKGYDLPACHAFLDRTEGADCLSRGCVVRRACPLSQAYGRLPEQSAYHMRLFHK